MSESFVAITEQNAEPAMFTWGWNEHGNLGIGDKKDRNQPVIIEHKMKAESRVYAGGAYMFLIN
jgi:alpha-tubulin suppressor-like RCC1 family protein